MDLRVQKILSLAAGILFILPVYILLHEGGHALIALLCGARITEFNVLGAYMRYEGGTFSQAGLSLFHIGGMLLPLLVSVIYMLTYRSKTTSIFYRIFSFISLLFPIGAVLAWVIVPLLYLSGQAPVDDDVTKFINSSGLSPWLVFLGAILLFAGCVFIALKKKIVQNYWVALKCDK